MTAISLLLIAPGLVVAYVVFIRPVLRAMLGLKTFYAEADSFWAKVWALCGKSVTIGWAISWVASDHASR